MIQDDIPDSLIPDRRDEPVPRQKGIGGAEQEGSQADEEGGGRGKGGAVKKREDTHRMAEANKAFSHFRW